jgi:integrase
MKNIKRLELNRYEIRFSYVDDLTDKRRRVRRRINGSLQDAVAHRDMLRAKAHRGELGRPHDRTGRPLSEWLDDYLRHRIDRDAIAESTAETARYVLTSNVLPDVGDWIPEGIELHHVDDLVNQWLDARKADGSPYSATTIKNRVGYLKRFLRWVLKRVGREPSFLRDADSVRSSGCTRKGRALTPTEARAFLEAMRASYPHHYALCFVLLATGQRFGSVTALEWGDVTDDWITFSRSQYRGDVKAGSKTGKVVRLPLTSEIADVLDWHRARMLESQHPGLSTGLIFPASTPPEENASNGYRVAGDLRHAFLKVCEAADIERCTPHDLRRTFNTWCAERVSGTVLRSITGHSSEAMTDHYYHGSRDAKEETIKGVLSLVK